MNKVTEVELKLDNRVLLEPRKCWVADMTHWGECSGQLSPYIAAAPNELVNEYILACEAHRKRMYILGWKKYQEE